MNRPCRVRSRGRPPRWLVPAIVGATFVMGSGVLGLLAFGSWSWSARGESYSFGEWFSAPRTGGTVQHVAEAQAALAAYLHSIGFVEDTTYLPGTLTEGTEVRLLVESFGGDEVGIWAMWSYTATGTRAALAATKLEQVKRDLEAWLETYEREHPMPESGS